MTLRLDKVAKPYIDAARIMENAILEFEYGAGQSDKMDASLKQTQKLNGLYRYMLNSTNSMAHEA